MRLTARTTRREARLGMIGAPASDSLWRGINLAAVAILLLAAVAPPPALLPL